MHLSQEESGYSMIENGSRYSDDEMESGQIIPGTDDPLAEYPQFTCASDILEAEELWIWDCLSHFSNTERLVTIMASAGM